MGDEDRVRQIVLNLLSNAVKFTGEGGCVTVRCGRRENGPSARLEKGGPWVVVEVEDTGPGIPEDKLDEVFEPFVQLENKSKRGDRGTGLGLPISRELAQRMGGDLTVQSRPGEGACFTLWLPPANSA